MRCDLLAVGTELLLGQIVDTNSAWIAEQLAAAGIDTMEQRTVGDNEERIVTALTEMLARADAVIVGGGLGPTQDDLTREALARLAGAPLRRRPELEAHIRAVFGARGREMAASNLRQADLPEGAAAIPNPLGTAPGIRLELGPGAGSLAGKVVYAVPGVPYEMRPMVTDHVLPDLVARAGTPAVIRSRSLRTWGVAESALAELIADRVEVQTNPTIAFLARGIEGIIVRLTAKARDEREAGALLDAEEAALRARLGEVCFGRDDETMESVVLDRLASRRWTLAVAESVTGGLVTARLTAVPGASRVLRGGVVAYATEVKRAVLGVRAERVVSGPAAVEMATGARQALGADVGIAITGVAGPESQEGQPVGTVWFGLALPGRAGESVTVRLPGDRERVRQFGAISLLNLLRLRLDADGGAPGP
jgi:nicotinamide-nucleotide amidase